MLPLSLFIFCPRTRRHLPHHRGAASPSNKRDRQVQEACALITLRASACAAARPKDQEEVVGWHRLEGFQRKAMAPRERFHVVGVSVAPLGGAASREEAPGRGGGPSDCLRNTRDPMSSSARPAATRDTHPHAHCWHPRCAMRTRLAVSLVWNARLLSVVKAPLSLNGP